MRVRVLFFLFPYAQHLHTCTKSAGRFFFSSTQVMQVSERVSLQIEQTVARRAVGQCLVDRALACLRVFVCGSVRAYVRACVGVRSRRAVVHACARACVRRAV